MKLTMNYPSWITTLWLLLLSHYRDGPTSTATAFVPEIQRRNPAAALLDQQKRGPLSEDRQIPAAAKVSRLASTATDSTRPATVSSVTRLYLPTSTAKNDWVPLVPPIKLFDDSNALSAQGVDITVEWQPNDDLRQVARSMLLEPAAELSKNQAAILVEHLEQCLTEFQSFCQQHLQVASGDSGQQQQQQQQQQHSPPPAENCSVQGFRARMVATRGPSGIKCPRWHVDHVPVRWIQSLVGPGCNYVECTQDSEEEWNRIKHQLEQDQHDKIIPIAGPSHLQVRQASEQEVALLVGNRWNEFAQEPHPFVPPVLHKSPVIPFWQGRVLLTIDVIVPHRHDD